MESLIYDRTLSDITNLTSKGQYNASDLNRVESWTNYLNDKFNEMGYNTSEIIVKFAKNVFNPAVFDGLTINADGTVKTTKYYADCVATKLKLEPNTTYRIGTYINGTVNNGVGFSVEVNGTWINYTWQSFATDSNGEVTLKVGADSWPSIGQSNFNIMMRKTSDNDSYVPYQGPVKGYHKKPSIGEVEYIESTGTQYIDTGISPKLGYEVEIGFQATNVPTGESWIYGIWESSGFRCGMSGGTYDNTRGFSYSQTTDKTGYIVANGNNTIKDYTGNAYLFAQQENGNAGYMANSKYKLYYCKIWDNNTLVRDYIPAIDPNGVVCLYDKVNKTYFYNKGTGNFLAGDRVSNEWKYKDDFVIEEADRIINNVSLLRGVIAMYTDTPVTPETMRFLDYIKANDIEKILFDINKLTENIIANYRYSNTFYSGEVGLD